MKKHFFGIRAGGFLLLAVFLLFLLLTRTDVAMDGVRQGLSLCAEVLFPSLFPFLVLSELIVASGIGEHCGRCLSRPVGALFGLSGGGAVALFLGTLCGFPVGTTTALSLYRQGVLDEGEVRRLLLFANNPSSGFLIGAVGGAMLGSREAGIALFLITLFSSFAVGLFLRIVCGRVPVSQKQALYGHQAPLSASDITAAVKRGFSALLSVSAFVLFFSCVAKCMMSLPFFEKLSPALAALLSGALEMTGGISRAVSLLSPALAFRVIAFLASFAGLSVCLQLFSVVEELRPPLWPYLLARLAQGAIALLFAELYLRVLAPDPLWEESKPTALLPSAPYPQTLHILLVLTLLLLLCPLFSLLDRRKAKKQG